MASYEEWVSCDQQKDQDPNSSLSAQTDDNRVVWPCPMETVKEEATSMLTNQSMEDAEWKL
eukprot:11024526-Prorocentrum_lima.AAC.1